jgi:undecaprenyl phosphate N,N'-diacetylbacillosamine 1-phosphate transferase
MYSNYIKRFFDFIITLICLVIFMPLFLTIAFILFFINKDSPFFYQKRPGKNEKLFYVIKFKTMTDEMDNKGVLLKDAERLTRFGTFIRKTSLDEIPQLINVLKGDMSLIGPRPLLQEYLPLYDEEQRKRHSVKPGITGWAQVNGRNVMLFSNRFKHDVWYVNNLSLLVDIRIIILTFKKVFLSEGNVPGQDVHDVDDLGFNKKI